LEIGMKRRLGFGRLLPVTIGNAGSRDPDFADFICATLDKCFRIRDYDSSMGLCPAARDDADSLGSAVLRSCHDASTERLCIEFPNHWHICRMTARNQECRFSQPVNRIKCVPAESGAFESLAK